MTTGGAEGPSSPVVRRAGPADAELLALLAAETFTSAYAGSADPTDVAAYVQESFTTDGLAAEVAAPGSAWWVADMSGVPVGYAHLRPSPLPPEAAEGQALPSGEGTVELVRLYARDAHIGRGVGSALMAAVLDGAAEVGGAGVWLGVWERNERAIAFYRRWGFRVVGTQEFLLGGDRQTDLLMLRALP